MPSSNAYHREYQRRRYRERVAEGKRMLGDACRACGGRDDLEFDHEDPTTKHGNVTRLTKLSWARFVEELVKCQLLCAPCHRAKTSRERKAA